MQSHTFDSKFRPGVAVMHCRTTELSIEVAYQRWGLWRLDRICGVPVPVQGNLQGSQVRQGGQSSVGTCEDVQEDRLQRIKVDEAQLPAAVNSVQGCGEGCGDGFQLWESTLLLTGCAL